MTTQVLRLRRTDSQSEQILLHVSKAGSKDLDLKFIGTNQEDLYHASIKESGINTLQSSNFTGIVDEWKTILKYTLLHQHPEGILPELLQGLEVVAAISNKKLTVTIRKNIGGITQRLGSIRLDEDTEREEVNAFEWADTAAANADALRDELAALQVSVVSQKEDVAKLNQQLDDLVKAKKEHEDELLQKFAALLNSKKLKIRDQQRLLNGAKIGPDAAEAVNGARSGKGRKPAASGSKKRGAAAAALEADEDVGEEEDDEEVPPEEAETPPKSEQETEDEDEDGFEQPPTSSKTSVGKSPAVTQNTGDMHMDDLDDLPPKRDLPFARRTTRQSSQQPPAKPAPPPRPADDDDDETDDEL